MDALEGVKVGDTIVIQTFGINGCFSTDTVDRVSKAHIFVAGDHYRISTGDLVGGDRWRAGRAYPFNDESKAKLARQAEEDVRCKLVVMLRDFSWGDLDIKELQAIIDAMPARVK